MFGDNNDIIVVVFVRFTACSRTMLSSYCFSVSKEGECVMDSVLISTITK